MENVFVAVLLLVVFSLVYILSKKIRKQKNTKSKYQQDLDKSLDKKLLAMLGGDKQGALRLLRNARKNHPGKSYLWYHEKVIRDLERDRRS